jgi:thioester reductase-like protein
LLRDGRDAITEVPANRWDLNRHYDPDPLKPLHQHVRRGGFIEDIDRFDAAFFGISPREALCMDPQQRLLLEVAWRALEHGGQPLERLRGQPVGVFIGISSLDYSSLLWASGEHYATPDNEPFVLPGNTGCIAANRISYFLDLKGPSFTVDTACSSSLVAVHLACESLWRGESTAALAGGVQALIHPGIQMSFCKAGLLAPDGRCKSFDARADGYVRSEGAGVVLLKPLSEARRCGDPIVALIHGTAVNSDGRSNGMAAPNLKAQIACVRQAFARSGLEPAATQYVEAHGTGTRQGDPIELRALGTVLGEGRPEDQPCRVGSVKTNLGHGETAAGITGLIKAALCVFHRQIPASLHFETPNPAIDFAGLKLQVQTALEPFPALDRPAVVGVSSFGFGGTNAHVVLAEAPPPEPGAPFAQPLPLQLLTLSARTSSALGATASRYRALLQEQPSLALSDLCASANQQRSAFQHRLVCLARDRADLERQLEDAAMGRSKGLEPIGLKPNGPEPRSPATKSPEPISPQPPAPGLGTHDNQAPDPKGPHAPLLGVAVRRPGKVAFLISGQGSEELALARGLYGSHPVFRAAFDRAAALADPNLERPLAQVLVPEPGDEPRAAQALGQTSIAQTALFVVGYALSELWASWGVRPDLLMGHGAGEVLAAHLAGVLNLADALCLVTARSQLLQPLPAEGAMAPMLEAFRQVVGHLKLAKPTRPLISSLSGDLAGAEIAEPAYWCDQVLGPVRFAKGLETLRVQGAKVFVDLGAQTSQTSPPSPTLASPNGPSQANPHQTLAASGDLAPAGLDQEPLVLPSLVADQEPWGVILTSLAQLHLRGLAIDWRGFHGPFAQRRVALPGYPFERQRHWWPSGRGPLPGAHRWLDHLGLAHQDQVPGEAKVPSPTSLEPSPGQASGLGAPGPYNPSLPASSNGFGGVSLVGPGGSSQRDGSLPNGVPRAESSAETLQAHGLAPAGLAVSDLAFSGLAVAGLADTELVRTAPAPTSVAGADQSATPSHAPQRLDLPPGRIHYQVTLDPSRQADLADHAIRNQPVFPAAGFLVLAAQVAAQEGLALPMGPLSLERPLRLGDGARQLQLVLEEGCLAFHSLDPHNRSAGWTSHGRLGLTSAPRSTSPEAAGRPAEAAPFTPSEAPAEAESLEMAGFYAALARCGLHYGPRFRGLQRVQRQGGQAWAELVRPAEGGVEGLLDSCFQLVAACLDPEAAGGQLFLPIGLESLSLDALDWPGRLFCEVRLQASPEPALVSADLIWHAPDPAANEALSANPLPPGAVADGPGAKSKILGWIRGFRLRRLPRQAVDWMFPSTELAAPEPALDPASWLIQSVWSPLDPDALATGPDPQDPEELAQGPLLLDRPLLIAAADHQAQAFEAWASAQGQAPLRLGFGEPLPAGSGPVLVWPDPASAEPLALVSQLLALVQQLQGPGPLNQANAGSASSQLDSGPGVAPGRHQARPLWLVLEGDGPWTGVLAGFAQTAALETPQLAWTHLHLPAEAQQQPLADDWTQLWRLAEAEASLRWRSGQPQGQRLKRLGRERFRVVSREPGRLDALVQQPLAPSPLLNGELEVAVEATGLNFRDVLTALGLLAAYGEELGLADGTQMPFGGECVGRVVAVGPGVDPALVGQRVLAALAVGSLASHVTCRADLCLPLPAGLDPETGASLSTVFLTALYGLVNLAQLQPGETVLIHAGAGGVGQAALQVARRCGARILATASAAKQQGLLDQGVEAVFDSRSLAFADQVLAHTGGRGVDVVLNSLKGDWVGASFQALAEGGRFVELGKIDIWSRAQAQERRPDATYLPFDLLEVAAADPQLVRQLLIDVLADLEKGTYQPIPIEVFPITAVEDAFRLLAQARHRGKVVIRQADLAAPLAIGPQATYLVTGALGGIGLRLIDWLVQRGATSLLLVSRSAANPGPEAQRLLGQLQARGIRCAQVPLDLGAGPGSPATTVLAQAIRALPAGQPLRGLFHAAGVLDDGLVGGLTPERLEAVLAPKLAGWQLLEAAVAEARASEGLDFAIAFSSLASLLGSPGQAAYGAANGGLDAFCRQKSGDQEQSLAQQPLRLAIQWGPWAGAGMAAGKTRRLEGLGIGVLPGEGALQALALLLERGQGGVVAVLNNDWPRLWDQADPRQRPVLAPLLQDGPARGGDGASTQAAAAKEALIARLAASTPGERTGLVVGLLQDRLGQVMGLSDGQSLDPGESLFHLGLDSLMAVEFAAGLQADLGLKVEFESLSGDPSLETLAELLLAELQPQAGAPSKAVLDLAEQARLDPEWRRPDPHGLASGATTPPGDAILLTGSTGFLGAYLLAGQLQRWPELRVRALVRCDSEAEGLDRIRTNLERYQLWQEGWQRRLEVVPGDLAQPQFGLDPQAFAALASGLGGILHNGAQLSQMASYGQLAPANVGGTREVLRLASLDRPLAVQMISSVAVFEATAYRNRVILETDDLAEWRGIHLGYSQTKWVSERLVLAAAAQGLPVSVYRPPLIGGDSRSGAWHQDDLLHRLLQGCLELGLAPDLAWELDLVPVDYVADAVTALAWRADAVGRCFHLQHPQPVMLTDLLGRLNEGGAGLEVVPMGHWLNAIDANPANPLYPLRAFFHQRWGDDQLTYPELNQLGLRARPRAEATVATLAALGVSCPRFDELISPYGRALLGASLGRR